MWSYLLLVAALASLSFAQPSENCGPCNRDECAVPRAGDCTAGLALDECGCCYICAKAEFQLCDHRQASPALDGRPHGQCGENLECRMREDLDPTDRPEAQCQCRDTEPLCGSDGVSYDNLCQLAAAGIRTQTKITVADKGPCKQAPSIVSKPDSVKEYVGNSVALVCEATGYPIPTVEWVWTRVDGKTVYLPSDDLHLAVNMRGGPEQFQVTGWLQVMEMKKEHEGDYTCIAQNELGVQQATARLNVVDMESRE